MAEILKSCGLRRNHTTVSFLVVGPADLCQNIGKGLHQGASQRNLCITVHQCESIPQITKPNLDLGIDFVIFAFDWRTTQSLAEVETNISLIDQHFIISGAACLVNCNGITNIMGLIFHKSRKIRTKYNIKFLSANVFNLQACSKLGNRILNLAEALLGTTSGIPAVGSLLEHS